MHHRLFFPNIILYRQIVEGRFDFQMVCPILAAKKHLEPPHSQHIDTSCCFDVCKTYYIETYNIESYYNNMQRERNNISRFQNEPVSRSFSNLNNTSVLRRPPTTRRGLNCFFPEHFDQKTSFTVQSIRRVRY